MERNRMSVVRAGVVVAALGVAALLDACSDSPGPCLDCPPPPTTGLIVSNPIPTAAAAAAASAAYPSGGKVVSASGDEVVYVSLTPGTAPSGSSASFRRVGAAQSTTAPMFEGGAGSRRGDPPSPCDSRLCRGPVHGGPGCIDHPVSGLILHDRGHVPDDGEGAGCRRQHPDRSAGHMVHQ